MKAPSSDDNYNDAQVILCAEKIAAKLMWEAANLLNKNL
jgi:hypothetical protein